MKIQPINTFNSIVCSLFLCILPWTTPEIHAQPRKDVNTPKVAVVLSGGGAKGFAHIGALKILEEEGIPIDIIVGTSMGSLIGGFYSLGYTAEEIEEVVKKQNWEMVLSDNVPRSMLSENNQMLKQRYLLSFSFSDVKSIGLPQGVIKGQNILNIFCDLAANVPLDADFSRFPISFACVATDLETGREVVINDGFFPTALFSSMAIPGIFQPVRREDLLLNVSFLFDFYSRSLFSSDNPLIKTTLVGDEPYSRYFSYHLPFVGLPPLTLTDRFTNISRAGFRVQVAKNNYLSFNKKMLRFFNLNAFKIQH